MPAVFCGKGAELGLRKKIDLWVAGRAGASRGGTESRPRLGSHHHPAHGKLQPGAAWIANRCCPGRCPDVSPPGRRGKNCLAGAPVSSRSRPGTIPSRPSSRSVITDWHGKKKKRETETAGPIRRDRSNGSRPTGATLEKRPCGRVDGPERARTGFAVDSPPRPQLQLHREGFSRKAPSPALRGLPTDAVRVGGRTHHRGEWERTAWLMHGFPHDRALFNTAMSAFPEGERNGKKKTRETVGPIHRDVSPGTCPRAASALKEDWNATRPMGRHRAPGGRDR